jgi:hypothetical protein
MTEFLISRRVAIGERSDAGLKNGYATLLTMRVRC